MDGEGVRAMRLGLRLSQGELKDELNRRLGRSYDKPKVSRWENNREPVPEDVAATLGDLVRRRQPGARTLVLANQKGGVGKTTSALNLACALARGGRRVLLVDMDPQATATVGLLAGAGLEAYRQGRSMAQAILAGRPMGEIIVRHDEGFGGTAAPFDIATSHIDLAETDGRREPGFDAALREALDAVRARYDWIIVDAPPNLGMLTWMSLAASEVAIIPVRTEPYDTMGVGLILGTINKVQRRLNPALRLAGILPTQFNARKFVDREVLAQLIAVMGDRAPVLEPVPDSAVFGHAARAGRIAIDTAPTQAAPAVYGRLASALDAGGALPRSAPPPRPPPRRGGAGVTRRPARASPILGLAHALIEEATGSLVTTGSRFRHSFEAEVGGIEPNPDQPRRHFDEAGIAALAATMRAAGQLQPILLRRHPEDARRWRIVAGERRWRAALLNGWPTILAIELDGDPEVAALLENLQRTDLSPHEEAKGLARLIESKGWTQEQAAGVLGRSKAEVSATLRILSLPPATIEVLTSEHPATRNVLVELARVEDPAARERLLALARAGRLTVQAIRSERERATAHPDLVRERPEPRAEPLSHRSIRSLAAHLDRARLSGRRPGPVERAELVALRRSIDEVLSDEDASDGGKDRGPAPSSRGRAPRGHG